MFYFNSPLFFFNDQNPFFFTFLKDTSDSHYNLGLLYRLNGDPHDARVAFKRARDVRVKCFGEHALEVAEVDVSAGFTDHQLGRLEEAAMHYKHAYAVRKRHLGELHPDTEEALSLLQSVRKSLGLSSSVELEDMDIQLNFNLSQISTRPGDRSPQTNLYRESSGVVQMDMDGGVASSPPAAAAIVVVPVASSPRQHQRRSTDHKAPITLLELEHAIDRVNSMTPAGREVPVPSSTRARMMRGASSTALTPEMVRFFCVLAAAGSPQNLFLYTIGAVSRL